MCGSYEGKLHLNDEGMIAMERKRGNEKVLENLKGVRET